MPLLQFAHRAASALALTTATLAGLSSASAQDRVEDPQYKLTVGQQRFSQSGNGLDINLRQTSSLGNAWVGYFEARGLEAQQWRGGWDSTFGDTVRLQPSLQFASGGFVGGSLNVETGKTWFVGAGFGRTNLQPYFNLNSDPNDSWSLSGGYRAANGASYSLSYTRDNRENPDQQHLHAVYRATVNGGERLTLDVLFKQGLVDGNAISKTGLTVTYDWPRYFVRLAFDPNTNFTADDAVRISVGTRF